ncbi:protein SIEVE ELEMENT OCCLUSION A-like [Macadamia integrifolia]|uniref:protein SIEVE ELEMENT OCCLUSION A-like n=1 Tax=Macadamia integrifolia TaxID=60698 RepID=UPI001C4ECA12|nr:protein SIEVE ELEMENT OCCLUSION A-like [Macadamia integrifolia]
MSALIKLLSKYSWDAKLILILAAFAVTYGGFFHFLGVVGVDKWKSLEKLRSIMEAMVKVTVNLIKARTLLPPASSLDQSIVQTAVYWTIRSVVACMPHIFGFLAFGQEYTPSESEDKELKKLRENVKSIDREIKAELDGYDEYIERNKRFEYVQKIDLCFNMIHTDNIKIVNLLLCAEGGLKPLFQVSTPQQRVGVEVLKNKNVSLLVLRELDFYQEEIGILVEMHKNTKQVSKYELVCFPVGKTSQSKKEDFETMLSLKKMPWYLVHHDHPINLGVIEYFENKWNFINKPILVVLDPQGRLISQNAFPNIRVRGGIDLPFTELWSKATWGLQLLLHTIEEGNNILQWIKEERFICLYGGEDSKWIEDFTKMAQRVTKKANIQFEMVYMGARNQTKRMKQNFTFIKHNNLSNCWPELVSKFWVRLESIWNSRMQVIPMNTFEGDDIMKGIKTMLTYDGSDKGWALISKGSKIMVKAEGDIILECFKQYDEGFVPPGLKDFMEMVIHYVKNQDTKLHCNRLILPVTVGKIPEEMTGEICHCTMEKSIMYRCCND